jgi:hypothetical protein
MTWLSGSCLRNCISKTFRKSFQFQLLQPCKTRCGTDMSQVMKKQSQLSGSSGKFCRE